MYSTQEPKYGISTKGCLFNRATGKEIPCSEPYFILRARDNLSLPLLIHYHDLCEHKEHKNAVASRIKDFSDYLMFGARNLGLKERFILLEQKPIFGLTELTPPKLQILNAGIKQNEPLFVFRAKDAKLPKVLTHYYQLTSLHAHRGQVQKLRDLVIDFQISCRQLVREPDTNLTAFAYSQDSSINEPSKLA